MRICGRIFSYLDFLWYISFSGSFGNHRSFLFFIFLGYFCMMMDYLENGIIWRIRNSSFWNSIDPYISYIYGILILIDIFGRSHAY